MTQVIELDSYQAAFEQLEAVQTGQPAWLRALRRTGFERFAAAGFPTTRLEDWKSTSVAPIAQTRFALGGPDGVDRSQLAGLRFAAETIDLVFVNGHYRADLSSGSQPTERVVALPLGTALLEGYEPVGIGTVVGEGHPFAALNAAFLQNGAIVDVAPQTIVQPVIHLIFVSTNTGEPSVSHPRVFIRMGENSQARVVETHYGPAGRVYFTNTLTEIVLEQQALLDHYKIQRDGDAAYHIGGIHVHGERASTYLSHSVTLGGALVRNDIVTVLGGEGIDVTLNGLYVADGQALVDNHTTVDHAMPHCGSHEVYKGILGGRGRAVFNGKIIVRPDAQKTDAKQTNKALLLSDDATINTKPQLEIFANDVKCTHGAAIGQLDEDAIFYLRSRGFDLREARDLLIHAFAGDVLNRFRLEPLRERVEQILMAAIPAH